MGVGIQAIGQTVDLVEFQVQRGRRQGDLRQAHQFHRSSLRRQGHPARVAEQVACGILGPAGRTEQAQRQIGLGEGQAHRIGVERVQRVDLAVVVGVDPVRAAHAKESVDLAHAHGQLIDLDLCAIGQLHLGRAFFEGGCAIHIHRAGNVQLHIRPDTDHLVVRALERQRLGAARAGDHVERRAGKVQHTATERVAQIDLHAGISHLRFDRGNAHKAGGACRGLQGQTGRHGLSLREHRRGEQAAPGGRCRQLRAIVVQRHRTPVDA